MPDIDPWDYQGNRENANGDLRCPGCPFGDESPGLDCFYGGFQQRTCHVLHSRSLDSLLIQARTLTLDPMPIPADVVSPQLTLDQALAIETCLVRTSSCNCLGRNATCMRSGEPVVVICLNQGDDGGICPGVH